MSFVDIASLRPEADEALVPIMLVNAACAELAGKRCPVPARRFRDLAANGVIPSARVGGRWFVRQRDIPTVLRIIRMLPEAMEEVAA